MNFKTFQFHPHIAAGVQALGYIRPTPVQLQSIPSILQGRDIMALAQTGTGKTAAFVLPILQRLMQGPRERLRALIIAPTRELAEHIHEAIGGLGKQTGLRSVTIYGGVAINPQIQKLRRWAEIAVACPGRLLDHISQGTINVSRLEILVLDEADRRPQPRRLRALGDLVPRASRRVARRHSHDDRRHGSIDPDPGRADRVPQARMPGRRARVRARDRRGRHDLHALDARHDPLEDVARASPGPKWFQRYVHKDRGLTRSLVERARRAGYRAIVLTVDTPILGRRLRDVRNRFALPDGLTIENLVDFTNDPGLQGSALASYVASFHDASLGFDDLAWLAELAGRILDTESISERPATVEDRAVPGHWEGDLLCGSKGSQIATLVERQSRYVMLLKFTAKDTETVSNAPSKTLASYRKNSTSR